MSTTLLQGTRTLTYSGTPAPRFEHALFSSYQALLDEEKLGWTEHLSLNRLLGTGGQGVVYLSQRRGSDNFTLPVALKIFSPERYEDEHSYLESMLRIAQVSCRVAKIQHDNLLDVQNFIERRRIRILEMEWIDGYDLNVLLTPATLNRARQRVSARRWGYINDVIATRSPERTRLQPGIAVAIVRQCLGALAALHREEIVHGDIKPSNIMVKRTGSAKIIDIGSAIDLNDMPQQRMCTPQYAAPEVLEREEFTPRSDFASLGYVLIELLSGRSLFSQFRGVGELLEAKRTLPQQLSQILPADVADSKLLMTICRRLISLDPMLRYSSAEEADTGKDGLCEFQRSLVKSNLASEYENELRVWLEELD